MADLPDSESPFIHDVIIIGAGPCGLAVAARLCERTPSAIFTDDEHQRYNWIRRHEKQMSIKNRKNGQVKQASSSPNTSKYSTLVLDGSGNDWMSRWNNLFKEFDIKHLRSPMFFHVDPGDRDGLLAYTFEQQREHELVEIRGCVGKEISKHQKKKKRVNAAGNAQSRVIVEERDRKDYQTPSTPLFDKYCNCIIDRYNLRKGLVQQATVKDIAYRPISNIDADRLRSRTSSNHLFRVETNEGVQYSHTLVLSIGPGNAPSIPSPSPTQSLPHTCHSMLIKTFPDPVLTSKIRARKSTHAVIIGGGLTSAQLSDLLIRRGVSHVHHLIRGPLKTKPFDIDLSWMGKFRNINQGYFYSAEDDESRLEQIKTARGGGSITPPYAKILKSHVTLGKLSIHTHTVLDLCASHFDTETNTWAVKTTPLIPELESQPVDFIYFCTGVQTNVASIPCLKTMMDDHPISTCGGLPCLTDDLMWKEDVPLFVTGRLAALRLGPGAANLGGARQGAERVVWGLEDWLGKNGGDVMSGDDDVESPNNSKRVVEKERRDSAQERDEYTTGRGNRFNALDIEELGEE